MFKITVNATDQIILVCHEDDLDQMVNVFMDRNKNTEIQCQAFIRRDIDNESFLISDTCITLTDDQLQSVFETDSCDGLTIDFGDN